MERTDGRRTRDDVLLGPHQIADRLLLDMRELLFECVGESECDHRQTRVVAAAASTRRLEGVLRTLEVVLATLAVDVAHADVPARRLQTLAE